MEFSPNDDGVILTIMFAGAVFALAGLWLIFRPKHGSSQAKIELFGLKFESSSAGLLVFLIGCAFFSSPLFVPKTPDRETLSNGGAVESSAQKEVSGATPGNLEVEASTAVTASPSFGEPRLIVLEGEEIEPNNTLASANGIKFGSVISGSVEPDDGDYFILDMPVGQVGEVIVTATAEWVGLAAFDDAGVLLSSKDVQDSVTWRGRLEGSPMYGIRVRHWNGRSPMPYQLTVAARPE